MKNDKNTEGGLKNVRRVGIEFQYGAFLMVLEGF